MGRHLQTTHKSADPRHCPAPGVPGVPASPTPYLPRGNPQPYTPRMLRSTVLRGKSHHFTPQTHPHHLPRGNPHPYTPRMLRSTVLHWKRYYFPPQTHPHHIPRGKSHHFTPQTHKKTTAALEIVSFSARLAIITTGNFSAYQVPEPIYPDQAFQESTEYHQSADLS